MLPCVFFYCTVQIEKELNSICTDVLEVLTKHLIPAASTGESKVFYHKMYVNVFLKLNYFYGIASDDALLLD